MRLADIARHIDARLVPADADDGQLEIAAALPIYEAGEGDLTLVESIDRLVDVAASAVITPVAIEEFERPQLVCGDPHRAFSAIVSLMRPPLDHQTLPEGVAKDAIIGHETIVHDSVVIAADVTIGDRCRIMPGVVIMGGCRIGDDVTIYPSVTLHPYTEIGHRCIIQSGCVLGGRGFGYRREGNRHVCTAQLGYVVIEDEVELGAAVTVDRGTYGTTRIGEGTKIDNQVMIAHNCQIGRRNLICSQVGVAGSCRTGDDVILAGQVGLKDHIELGDGTIVGAQAGVMENLAGNEVYLGSPCTSQRDQMQIMAVQRRLPEMRRDLKKLMRTVASMQSDAPESAGPTAAASNDSAGGHRRQRRDAA